MTKGHVSVSITTGTFIRALLIGAGAYVLWILQDLVLLVVTAVVIASAIEPGMLFFVKRKIPRVLGALCMYVAVFGSLFGAVYIFAPPLLSEAAHFLQTAPQYLDTLDLPQQVKELGTAAGEVVTIGGETQSTLEALFAIRSAFGDAGEGAFRFVSSIFGGLFSFLLVIVLSFYLALQATGVDDFLRLITPAKHEDYVIDLWLRAKNKIGLWMQGQLVLSAVSAVIIYLGLSLIGVPYALLLALLTAVADLIPIFGSCIGAIPAILIAFSAGGLTAALLTAGLFLVMNLLQANLIYPAVVNRIVGIPPLMVILALIVGGTIAGFLGILLSVPIAAALREFLNDFDRDKRAMRASGG
jgi:predicted PurR-regulated permease PerM